MNAIFAGGNQLGANCLIYLIKKRVNIVAVLCRHDEYFCNTEENNVFAISLKNNIPIFNDEKSLLSFVSNDIDIGICIMFPKKLSKDLITCPKIGFYNFHGAPLPKYRGCMGHIWAILNKENQYAVTVHKMTENYDDGPILKQIVFPISCKETGITLHRKAEINTFVLFKKTIKIFVSKNDINGRLRFQDESLAKYYNKTIPNDSVINWNNSAVYIERFIRALLFKNVLPPYTFYNGEKIHIYKVYVSKKVYSNSPGEIIRVSCKKLIVAAKNGSLLIYKKHIINPELLFNKIKENTHFNNGE